MPSWYTINHPTTLHINNETQWTTAACQCHFALRDVFCRQSWHLSITMPLLLYCHPGEHSNNTWSHTPRTEKNKDIQEYRSVGRIVLFLFLIEEAYSHSGLQTGKLALKVPTLLRCHYCFTATSVSTEAIHPKDQGHSRVQISWK